MEERHAHGDEVTGAHRPSRRWPWSWPRAAAERHREPLDSPGAGIAGTRLDGPGIAVHPPRWPRPSAAAVDWKTATSAGAGGVDAVCAAGKAEGPVNLIATPPDWANYGQMITDFTAKYGIKVQSDQPDADSQTEINTAQQLAGTGRQPDIFDLGTGRRPREHRHVRAVPGRRRGRTSRPPTRRPPASGSTTTPASRRSATTPRSATITKVADLADPKYKGKVALNGDPLKASAGFNGVVLAALANGGSADNIAPGVDFFKNLADIGNLHPGRPEPGHDRVGPDPDRHRLDVQQRRARSSTLAAEGHHLEDRRPDRRTAGRRVLQRGDQQGRRRTRPPRAAGWSTSSPTPARTPGSRASPCRSASRPCRRPARSTRPRSRRSTRRRPRPVQLTPDQIDAAKTYLDRQLEVHHHQVAHPCAVDRRRAHDRPSVGAPTSTPQRAGPAHGGAGSRPRPAGRELPRAAPLPRLRRGVPDPPDAHRDRRGVHHAERRLHPRQHRHDLHAATSSSTRS